MQQQLIWLERIVKKQPINLTSMPTVNQKYKTRTSVHIISTFQTVVPVQRACITAQHSCRSRKSSHHQNCIIKRNWLNAVRSRNFKWFARFNCDFSISADNQPTNVPASRAGRLHTYVADASLEFRRGFQCTLRFLTRWCRLSQPNHYWGRVSCYKIHAKHFCAW